LPPSIGINKISYILGLSEYCPAIAVNFTPSGSSLFVVTGTSEVVSTIQCIVLGGVEAEGVTLGLVILVLFVEVVVVGLGGALLGSGHITSRVNLKRSITNILNYNYMY
jgi:hypothetical protein